MRRLVRMRGRDLWQRQLHALLAHRPCPPVAHSITLVALFSSAWTSEANGSSGSIATGFADFTEKRVPATAATSLADFEVDHDMVTGWPKRSRLKLFGDFFLFSGMATQYLLDSKLAARGLT
jgi:hypothetical protein